MFYSYSMHIPSALRRKRDEIAATIAAYEARIDAARMDLAALDQVARLLDPEAGRDETHRGYRKAGRYPSSGMRSLGVGVSARHGPIGASRNPRREGANSGGLSIFG